jgi:hypothetical protein
MLDLNALVGETLKYGFPGVVILCLVAVILHLRKEYREDRKICDDKFAALQAKNEEIQEKRIAEGRESLNALNNTTNVLDDVLKALQARGAN